MGHLAVPRILPRQDLGRLRSLVQRLPPFERAALTASVLLDVLMRFGVVLVAIVAVGESRTVAVALGAVVLAFTATRRGLDNALRRRCRVVLYDSAVEALLHGPVLAIDDERHDESLVAIAEAVWVGETFLATSLPGMLGDFTAGLLLGAFLVFQTSWHVTALSAGAVIAVVAAIVAARRLTAHVSAATQSAFRPIHDSLTAAHQGRLDLVAAGRDAAYLSEARAQLRHWRDVSARGDLLAALAGRAPVLLATVAVAIAVVLDERLRGALEAVAVRDAVVVASVVPAFVGLSRHAAEIARASSKLRPLMDVLEAARSSTTDGLPLPSLPATIEWRRITFSYDEAAADTAPVLREADVTWRPGQVLIVCGANGSGKSTLFRLLLGLARPQHGVILVGGVALSRLDLGAWRRAVSYLPQRPYFRDDEDVRGAVRFLVPQATDDEIERALARVGLLPALRRRHPNEPLHTRVAALSAGQRQRLALARLLCRESAVVLLDEPDANLDAAGVGLVVELVRELALDHMVAVAAHGEELVSMGDLVVTVSSGSVTDGRSYPFDESRS